MRVEELTLNNEMKHTWLIQRLKQPERPWKVGDNIVKDNPFSFGGGVKNGGLSDKAMDLIRDIFSFDYMGAAEFEWGAVPAAILFIGEQSLKHNLIASRTECHKDEIVFYICPTEYRTEVINRIHDIREDKLQLCEWAGLNYYFDDKKYTPKNTVGWLELDNGFMFFVDRIMFDKTCKLFGIAFTV
jgi:hypothetical protein